MMIFVLLMQLLHPVLLVEAQTFRLPEREACLNRTIDVHLFGTNYHYSWKHSSSRFSWVDSRNYCRRFCMDALQMESDLQSQIFADIIENEEIDAIWTGGRKCNFQGCQRDDLVPNIVNGWFWAPTGIRIARPNECSHCHWSNKGGLGESQPDNRQGRSGKPEDDEACIAVLNNFYDDGVRWHDVACTHPKFVICQDHQALLNYVGLVNEF